MTSLRVGPEGVSTEQLVEQMEDQMDNRQDEMGSAVLSNVNMELIVVQRLKVGKKKREKKQRGGK